MNWSHEPEALTTRERQWGTGAHVAGFLIFVIPWVGQVLGPLSVWVFKRGQSSFIDHHAREALNFQINACVYFLVGFMFMGLGVGCFVMPVVFMYWFLMSVLGAARASEGQWFRYPGIVRIV